MNYSNDMEHFILPLNYTWVFNAIVYNIVGIRCLYAIFDKGRDVEYYDSTLNVTVSKHIRTLPHRAWLPIDVTESPGYEIMFFIQATCPVLYGIYISYIDSIVYGLMIHMNTQYIILTRLLKSYVPIAKSMVSKSNVGSVDDDIDSDDINVPENVVEKCSDTVLLTPVQDAVENIINYCVRYHLEILHYCDQIESEFCYPMLMQFLSSLYIFCFQLYQLSVMQNYLSFDFISMCFYLSLMMYQLFCFCWYGNEVMIYSSQFSADLYNTEWLLTNEKTKKVAVANDDEGSKANKVHSRKVCFAFYGNICNGR
ncbi:hypothetical protein NQ318_004641 [Aromia moschata]|uniref:Odorant receptor n=1 Tax=Aromia moschata TaxID=1265417 RepID=A0AAV8Y4Y6_9CUCU|nr:hypothetical protein NQ318_004641 [Aromia moschata]